jgi:hypothetical protein
MKIRRYLELSQEIEETVAAIYRDFVDRFAADAMLRQLWQQMAQDEHDHAMQIKLAFPLLKEGLLCAPQLDIDKVEALLRQARQLTSDLQGRPLTAVAALKLGLQMEERFCQVHVQAQLAFGNRELDGLFRALARADEAHIDTLRQGLAHCQSREATQAGT